jgi:hypothetical protein
MFNLKLLRFRVCKNHSGRHQSRGSLFPDSIDLYAGQNDNRTQALEFALNRPPWADDSYEV